MKIYINILLGILFCYLSIYIFANINEDGNKNAVGMYFLVFRIPMFIVILINAFFLEGLRTFQLKQKRLFSAIPIFILLLLIMTPWQIPFADGSLSFIGITGSIGLAITNLLWNLKLKS